MQTQDQQPGDLPSTALHVFRRLLPSRVKLGEIVRSLGSTQDRDCLAIAARETLLTYHLQRREGRWQTLVLDDRAAEKFKEVIGPAVVVMQEGKLPFKDKTYDAVVVLDALESAPDDEALIVECHRVLKPAGRLVVTVPNARPWSLIRPFQILLGLTDEKRRWKRRGYSETQLFKVLKDGFDVHHLHSFSKFFVEFVSSVSTVLRIRQGTYDSQHEAGLSAHFGWMYPLFWVAYQLDFLLFFARGNYLIANAKRRAWLPRKTPVLSDGRSITEAVLSKIKD